MFMSTRSGHALHVAGTRAGTHDEEENDHDHRRDAP